MPQGALFAAIARKFSGALGPARLDQQASLWTSQRHGKYYAGTYGTSAIASPATAAVAGATFRCANQTAATLSAALAATYTGLCISNPAGSTVNLAIKRVAGMFTTAPGADCALGLILGFLAAGITVHTTPLDADIVNNYVGAAAPASQAHVDAACSLVGTPLWVEWMSSNTAATTNNVWFSADLDESIIIPPGGYLAIGGSKTGGGFLGSFAWEEIAP